MTGERRDEHDARPRQETPGRRLPTADVASGRAQVGARDVRRIDGWRLLLALLGAPVAWTLHLLVGYVLVAFGCATAWDGTDLAVLALTVLCAAAAIAAGLLGLRLWRQAQEHRLSDEEPGDDEPWDGRLGERGARANFLAIAGVMLAILFTYAIVIEGLPPLFAPTCSPATHP